MKNNMKNNKLPSGNLFGNKKSIRAKVHATTVRLATGLGEITKQQITNKKTTKVQIVQSNEV